MITQGASITMHIILMALIMSTSVVHWPSVDHDAQHLDGINNVNISSALALSAMPGYDSD